MSDQKPLTKADIAALKEVAYYRSRFSRQWKPVRMKALYQRGLIAPVSVGGIGTQPYDAWVLTASGKEIVEAYKGGES